MLKNHIAPGTWWLRRRFAENNVLCKKFLYLKHNDFIIKFIEKFNKLSFESNKSQTYNQNTLVKFSEPVWL